MSADDGLRRLAERIDQALHGGVTGIARVNAIEAVLRSDDSPVAAKGWQTAALLKDRTRRAIRECHAAVDSAVELAALVEAEASVAALTARCRELEARLDRMKELQRFTEDNEIHWMREHEALAARCATLEARVKADE